MIRDAEEKDLKGLLELYLFLHEDNIPDSDNNLEETWNGIIHDPNHHIILGVQDNQIVSSCACIIIPNLTRGIKPYALIENVVTHDNYRRMGWATECLKYAKNTAISNDCYKIMLLTSHKDPDMLDFYKKAGFNNNDKRAFIQWI